ncbi:hypothetical protein CLF_103366 [Clonorchis sinensis]|uniref:Uncharacterized protein n=1 Tax=Clonorchis sinensis TaxID=79923 RepID=G7Y9M6_CLOSI|nr:hypothetical protein CLF_103366 [Clonorchis sinensis]
MALNAYPFYIYFGTPDNWAGFLRWKYLFRNFGANVDIFAGVEPECKPLIKAFICFIEPVSRTASESRSVQETTESLLPEQGAPDSKERGHGLGRHGISFSRNYRFASRMVWQLVGTFQGRGRYTSRVLLLKRSVPHENFDFVPECGSYTIMSYHEKNVCLTSCLVVNDVDQKRLNRELLCADCLMSEQGQWATECATPGRLMFQLLRYSRYRDTCIFVMHYWCSTFSCLKTSQTRDSAGFQVAKQLRVQLLSGRLRDHNSLSFVRISKEDKTMVVQSAASSDDVHPNVNKNTGSTVDSKSRLLTRRKQYSENRVPTISLDDPGVSTSSPNIATSLLSPPSLQQSQHRHIPSTVSGLHPGCCNISPLAIPRLDVSMSQRALSASPSKDSSAGKLISYGRNVLSACSMDSVGLKKNDSFRSNQLSDYNNPPHLFTPSSTQSPPGTSPAQLRSTLSSRLMAISPGSPPNSGISATSLVQQRSTESHESSISMPSATSSGSSGIPHSRARISRLAFHDRLINRSHENTPNTGSSRSPHSEPQTVHRRSSYEELQQLNLRQGQTTLRKTTFPALTRKDFIASRRDVSQNAVDDALTEVVSSVADRIFAN